MGKINATDEELQALYRDYPIRVLALIFDVTEEAIRKRLQKSGTKMRPKGSNRDFDPPRQELEAIYQGKSMREVARHYGVGETVVFRRLKEHGITLRDYEKGGHRLKPGRIFSKEHKRNISLSQRGKWSGEKNPHWKGGVHQQHLKLRASGAYRLWKAEALELRGHQCQQCGVPQNAICECCGTMVRLHVHHVESFAEVPDKRFDPHNSEVLCPKCHHSRHNGKIG